MFKNEREREILKYLQINNYMTVLELSKLLYTSESSIRRDLTSLEKQGLVKRSYGGAEPCENPSTAVPFSVRSKHNILAKKAMAKKAAALLKDKSIVFLDQSSSAFFTAEALKTHKGLTVVTNNPEIVVLLSDTDFDVISSGGILSRDNRNCLLGDDAHRIFSQIHADIMFFSVKALTLDGSLYDCSREEVCIRNTMLLNADKKVFLCDTEKFGTYAGFKQCELSDIDIFISENDKNVKLFGKFPNLTII